MNMIVHVQFKLPLKIIGQISNIDTLLTCMKKIYQNNSKFLLKKLVITFPFKFLKINNT